MPVRSVELTGLSARKKVYKLWWVFTSCGAFINLEKAISFLEGLNIPYPTEHKPYNSMWLWDDMLTTPFCHKLPQISTFTPFWAYFGNTLDILLSKNEAIVISIAKVLWNFSFFKEKWIYIQQLCKTIALIVSTHLIMYICSIASIIVLFLCRLDQVVSSLLPVRCLMDCLWVFL